MPYSTTASVRLALSPSDASDPTFTASDLPDLQIVDAIAEADSTIDMYIGGRYLTPVAANPDSTIPHPIDYWSRNIAAYVATLSFRENQEIQPTDPIQLRYTATMAALKAVQTGAAVLAIPSNLGPTANTGAGDSVNPYSGNMWTLDSFNLGASNYGDWLDASGLGPYGTNW